MRIRYISLVVVLLTLVAVFTVFAASGTLDSSAPPDSTSSYTLEDIYNRLDAGTGGTQSTFTEPSSGPTAGTGHTLNQIMAQAPAVDDTNGVTQTHVLTGTTFWGLTSGQWGVITGTMPDNGAVTIVPTTTAQTIAVGYHNGSGQVEGDANLWADNIVSDVVIFGVTGTYPWAPVPQTGQTTCHDADGWVIDCNFTGLDGEHQMGVAWPSPRLTDNGNGTVTDNLTGLIWLKDANCYGTRSWANALSDANALANGTCSLSDGSSAGDWRLPNVRELQPDRFLTVWACIA